MKALVMTFVGVFMLCGATLSSAAQEQHWPSLRQGMVRSIETDVIRHRGTLGLSSLSPEVKRALAKVPRHLFVPQQFRSRAYDNSPLPIGHHQTISQPTIVALMTELLELTKNDTVLEVGTGSGYQAAILAEVAGQIHTIEIIPELVFSSRKILKDLGYQNISVHEGDGYAGLPERSPFDAIIVTAAPPTLPPALLDQLKPGGRLVAPVGAAGATQWLKVWIKQDDGSCEIRKIIPVRFVPMVSGANQ